MRLSTFTYCLKEGMKNIGRNIWFSLASTAIISACIFLFCMFFALVANVQYMVKNAETTVGITVFFDENMAEADILAIGKEIAARKEIKETKYISAEEAWETFQKEYFKDAEELAEGFADDNPLAGSASYEIYLKDIADQDVIVSYLNTITGIRKINYSNDTASGLSTFNKAEFGSDYCNTAGGGGVPDQQYDFHGSGLQEGREQNHASDWGHQFYDPRPLCCGGYYYRICRGGYSACQRLFPLQERGGIHD